ncbi:uncharacterized protein J8A68_002097, partial [[Candida] subhashii]
MSSTKGSSKSSLADIKQFESTSTTEKTGFWTSVKDSFKPAIPTETLTSQRYHKDGTELTDLERINLNSANSNLSRKLKTRHLQMISIGSSIGTGLFVGTGGALATGGPAGIMI